MRARDKYEFAVVLLYASLLRVYGADGIAARDEQRVAERNGAAGGIHIHARAVNHGLVCGIGRGCRALSHEELRRLDVDGNGAVRRGINAVAAVDFVNIEVTVFAVYIYCAARRGYAAAVCSVHDERAAARVHRAAFGVYAHAARADGARRRKFERAVLGGDGRIRPRRGNAAHITAGQRETYPGVAAHLERAAAYGNGGIVGIRAVKLRRRITGRVFRERPAGDVHIAAGYLNGIAALGIKGSGGDAEVVAVRGGGIGTVDADAVFQRAERAVFDCHITAGSVYAIRRVGAEVRLILAAAHEYIAAVHLYRGIICRAGRTFYAFISVYRDESVVLACRRRPDVRIAAGIAARPFGIAHIIRVIKVGAAAYDELLVGGVGIGQREIEVRVLRDIGAVVCRREVHIAVYEVAGLLRFFAVGVRLFRNAWNNHGHGNAARRRIAVAGTVFLVKGE